MDKYEQLLTKYWGYPKFRPLQRDIIESVVNGNDTLALMPTGGGKSITFQVPGLFLDGVCLVVTPLIALMKDQVERLQKNNIPAFAIYSGMHHEEIKSILNKCIHHQCKFLYCSPERLQTELFMVRAEKIPFNLIAIDESHCISQWGYDFRPSYLQIAEIRKIIPNIPILALTATATPRVANDIQEKLLFKRKNVLKQSFERKNLAYVVRKTDDKLKEVLTILQKVPGSSIIYVRSRKKTKEIALFLNDNQINANYYHAGLDIAVRNARQESWLTGNTRVMVSTNAFGMGIDKSNVRTVIHIEIPDSLEEYYQEAGRAGRDGNKAFAILLFNDADIRSFDQRIDRSFPDIADVKRVYQAIGNYFQIPIGGSKGMIYEFKIEAFCKNYGLSINLVYNAFKILQSQGYLEATEEINTPSKIHFIVNKDDLYKFQISNFHFDEFIKLLLRSYTGLFTDYAVINEDTLATRANTSRQTIYDYLCKLKSQKIIDYIPQRNSPLLIMTEERIDEKNLLFSKENYSEKKELYRDRLDWVKRYLLSTTKCRSQILLEYFDEHDANRCGVCDICLTRNELGLSKYEFDQILNEIKNYLHKQSSLIQNIVDDSTFNKEKVLQVITWLIENHKIIYTDEQKLTWNHE